MDKDILDYIEDLHYNQLKGYNIIVQRNKHTIIEYRANNKQKKNKGKENTIQES